jgi:hypothetical protein
MTKQGDKEIELIAAGQHYAIMHPFFLVHVPTVSDDSMLCFLGRTFRCLSPVCEQ